MTQFTEFEQRTMDLDWFAVDLRGELAHLTSNGSRLLPQSVAADKEGWEKVYDYMYELPLTANAASVSPGLAAHQPWYGSSQDEAENARRIQSFWEMACRGLYSYDSYDFSRKERPYFRVAIPHHPLNIDKLPGDIRAIVQRTQLPVCFADADLILEDLTR